MQRYAKSGLYSIVAGDVTYINYDEDKGIVVPHRHGQAHPPQGHHRCVAQATCGAAGTQ